MATFIPKNARQILSNAAKARDYFLKPYGLDVSLSIVRHPPTQISLKNIQSTNSSKRR